MYSRRETIGKTDGGMFVAKDDASTVCGERFRSRVASWREE